MAVSKRTRYEVLRRDDHACRYCGAAAPEAKLTVDHVTPVALGGTDNPDNLVAACKDCNAGKTSTTPGAPLVEDVKAIDVKWSGAIRRVVAARARQQKKRARYCADFLTAWDGWHMGGHDGPQRIPLASNWQASLERFYELGVPIEDVVRLVDVACGNDRIRTDETFRYFCGCVWREVTAIQEAAKALLAAEEADA